MKNYVLTIFLALLVVLSSVGLRRSVAAIGGAPVPMPPTAIGGAPVPMPPTATAIGGAPVPMPPTAIGGAPVPMPPLAQDR